MKARFDAAADLAPDMGTQVISAADAAPDTGILLRDASVDATATMATITFRLKNTGTDTVYVYSSCTIPIKVTSLADGTTYGNGSFCGCNCASPSCNGGVECGVCAPNSGIPIAVGSTQDVFWMAQRTTFQTRTGTYGTFQCQETWPIPTGRYKVAIDLYTNDSDAVNRINSHTVEQVFDLGAANATIEVEVQ